MPVPVDVIRFAFWREEFMKSVKPTDDCCLQHKARDLPGEIEKCDGMDRKFEGTRVSLSHERQIPAGI